MVFVGPNPHRRQKTRPPRWPRPRAAAPGPSGTSKRGSGAAKTPPGRQSSDQSCSYLICVFWIIWYVIWNKSWYIWYNWYDRSSCFFWISHEYDICMYIYIYYLIIRMIYVYNMFACVCVSVLICLLMYLIFGMCSVCMYVFIVYIYD